MRSILKFVKNIPTSIMAGMVFMAGMVNLVSVAIPPRWNRYSFVIQNFHFRFVEAAHWTALIAGVGLLTTSIYIYRRKYRAFQFAFILIIVSIALHITKGLDYEEGLLLLGVMLVLWLNRYKFTVRSNMLSQKQILSSTTLSIFGIIVYGVIGYLYYQAVNHFEPNIVWALRQTIQTIIPGQPAIFHLTARGVRFASSIRWLTLLVIVLNLAALFRPMQWILTHEKEAIERAKALIKKWSLLPYDHFKVWPVKSLFFSPAGNSIIAYGVARGNVIALGDPVGDPTDIDSCITNFQTFCRDHGWKVAYYQTSQHTADFFRKKGMKFITIGEDAIIDLKNYSDLGVLPKDFRYAVNRFGKMGYQYKFIDKPLSEQDLASLNEVSASWLTIPGHRERSFTLGEFDESYLNQTSVFTVFNGNGEIQAFCNLLKSEKGQLTAVDLMRYRHDAPSGIMDYLFLSLFMELSKQGEGKFSLGLAPFSHFKSREDLNARVINSFLEQLSFIFNFKGIRKYKAKFTNSWEPRYLVFESYTDLPGILLALRLLTEKR